MMTLSEMLALGDAAAEEENLDSKTFEPLPAGTYDVAVVACEGPTPTKRANPENPNQFGCRLNFTFNVITGTHSGRKLFLNNNLVTYPKTLTDSDKAKAQKCMAIGARERKVLLASIGKTTISASEEFVGATCRVEVAIENDLNGNPKNTIRKVMSSSGAIPEPTATPKTATAPAAATPTTNKLPWE